MEKRTAIFGVACFVILLLVSSLPAGAVVKGDWIVRGRFINVNPNDTSDGLEYVPGGHLGTENNNAFELDVVWAITPHWNLELSVTDVDLDLEGRGTWSGQGDVATYNALPVTLTAQYRFLPSRFASPYVGLGVNYTNIHDVDPQINLVEGSGTTRIHMDDSWGWAAQVGVDLFLSEHWSVNFDVKYIDIDSETEFETDGVAMTDTTVHIEPWVSAVGVGFRF